MLSIVLINGINYVITVSGLVIPHIEYLEEMNNK